LLIKDVQVGLFGRGEWINMTREERFFWTLLLIIMLVSYGFAILQIFAAVGFSPGQIMTHYRGNEAEMLSGMAFKDLARLSHIHASGMSLLFIPAAFILARYVGIKPRWKRVLLLAGFGGILLDIASWWGLVYLGAAALPLLFAAGALFGLGMAGASLLALKWMWFTEKGKMVA